MEAFPPWMFLSICVLLGLLVGSFFNVVIYRMPRGESIVFPASHCTACNKPIPWYCNVPVFSWLVLKGRCLYCRSGIGAIYPVVEACSGLIAGLLGWWWVLHEGALDPAWALALAYLAMVTLPICIIDFRHFLIPDALTLPGILFGVALSFLPGGLTPLQSIGAGFSSGFLLWFVGFLATKALKKDAMGFGDVKLIAMGGALLGFLPAFLGLMLAAFLGTLFGLPMMLAGRLNQQRHIPFGPFICFGILLAAFRGPEILDWYLGLLRP